MKRLLCIVSGMNAGGAETFLMKIYREIDRSRYQMDFCVSDTEVGIYENEITKYGGSIYRIPAKSKNFLGYKHRLFSVVNSNSYKYVLRISSNAAGFLDLKIAKKAGAEICSVRSSNSSDGQSIKLKVLHVLGHILYDKYLDRMIAPSLKAAEYTFGTKAVNEGRVIILNNGIDTGAYKFEPKDRQRIRKEFGINSNSKVIIHIGRFNEQKNHAFLIRAFKEVNQIDPKAILILVGEGELKSSINELVKELQLEGSVIFTGLRTDVSSVMSASDVLALPSFYEGMPNVVIEAQANGLPCIISDKVTKEADITGLVEFLPIEKNYNQWARKLLSVDMRKEIDYGEILKTKGYDIRQTIEVFTSTVFSD